MKRQKRFKLNIMFKAKVFEVPSPDLLLTMPPK